MSDWKPPARNRFPDYSQLIELSAKPADFLTSFAAVLPTDSSPDAAFRHTMALDGFLFEMLCIDPRFCMRRGVVKGIRQLRERLEDLTSSKPSPAQTAGDVAAADAFAQAFLADDEHPQEALSWLRAGGDKHTLGESASTSGSIRLLNAVYRAGATKVWAVQIDSYPDGSKNTGKLVIELPQEPALRRQVFEWASRKSKAKGFGGITDEGQHYVFLMLD
jgi:hypothetical protein